ncbi:phage antirepressor KilAC domain-containing protein [Escherichia coli]|nr:phage antirepressor KilAC domain-containing protein [Escherichia coli]
MQQTFNADMNISNLHQNVDPSTTLPVICGVEITTDRADRYNLNALHRASGLGAHKAPAQWLRTLSAKQLIEELEKETMQNCIVSFEGRSGGTFAHELLAVEYAGWISPAFRLKVNQTFIDYRAGRLQPAIPQSLPEALRLAADLAEQKQRLEQKMLMDAPKVEFAERVATASGVLIGNYAKVLGLGQNYLFTWLRDNGILIATGERRNVPKQEYISRGYFTLKETVIDTSNGSRISFTTRITGKGQQWLMKRLLDAGVLVPVAATR